MKLPIAVPALGAVALAIGGFVYAAGRISAAFEQREAQVEEAREALGAERVKLLVAVADADAYKAKAERAEAKLALRDAELDRRPATFIPAASLPDTCAPALEQREALIADLQEGRDRWREQAEGHMRALTALRDSTASAAAAIVPIEEKLAPSRSWLGGVLNAVKPKVIAGIMPGVNSKREIDVVAGIGLGWSF